MRGTIGFLFLVALSLLPACKMGSFFGGTSVGTSGSQVQSAIGQVVALIFSGTLTPKAGDCNKYTIRAVNSAGETPDKYTAGSSFTLTATGTGGFFPTSACDTAEVTTVSVDNDTEADVFFKGATIGSYSLTARDRNGIGTTISVNVQAGPPVALVLDVPVAPAQRVCTRAKVSLKDRAGNNATLSAAANVRFLVEGASRGGAFSDPDCRTAISAPFDLFSEKDVYLFFNNAGVANITALTTNLSTNLSDTEQRTIAASESPRLVVIGPEGNIPVPHACVALTVQAQSTKGEAMPVRNEPLGLTLATSSTDVTVKSDALCKNELASPFIPVGQSSTVVYTTATLAPQNFSVEASASGYVSGRYNGRFISGPPVALSLLGLPATIRAAACSGAVLLSLLDVNGNQATVTSNVDIDLIEPGGTAPKITFSDSNVCSGPAVTSLRFTMDQGVKVFSLSGDAPGDAYPILFRAPAASGITSAEGHVTFTNALGSLMGLELRVVTNPYYAGDVGRITIFSRDAKGNPLDVASAVDVNVAYAGIGATYKDELRTQPSTQFRIEAKSNRTDFFITGTTAGTHLVTATTATGPAITNSTSLTTQPNVVRRLTMTGGPNSIQVGQVATGNVTRTDAYGNPSRNPNVPLNFTLNGANTKFFTDGTGGTPALGGILDQLSVPYFHSGSMAGEFLLTAIAEDQVPGISPGTRRFTYLPAPPVTLKMELNPAAPPNPTAGKCTELVITQVNTATGAPQIFQDNLVQVTADTENPRLFFGAADTKCATPLVPSSLTLTTANNPGKVRISQNKAGSFNAYAYGQDGSTGLLAITIAPDVPSQLEIPSAGTAVSALVNQCFAVAVNVKDRLGNLSPVTGDLPLVAKAENYKGSIAFYDKPDCTGATLKVADGKSSATIYGKASEKGEPLVKVTSGALTPGQRTVPILLDGDLHFFLADTEIKSLDFGKVEVGPNATKRVVTLKNTSDEAMASQVDVTGFAAPFSLDPALSTCGAGTTLQGRSSCTLVIGAAASALGKDSGNITANWVNSQGQKSASNLSLLLEGVPSLTTTLAFNRNLVDFGDTFAGRNKGPEKLELQNTSPTTAATMVKLKPLSADFKATGVSGCGADLTVPFTLPANGKCVMDITATPKAGEEGERSVFMSFDFNDGQTDKVTPLVALTQKVATPASLQLFVGNDAEEATSVNFGTTLVGRNVPKRLRLKNVASTAATSVQLLGLPSGPFTVQNNPCSSVPAKSTCVVDLLFSPTAIGSAGGMLTVRYINDGGTTTTDTVPLPLAGAGGRPAVLQRDPAGAVDLGVVAKGATQTAPIVLTNIGDVDATAVVFTDPGGGAFKVVDVNTAAGVAPGKSALVRVSFTPPTEGPFTGATTISYNDGQGVVQMGQAPLYGVGAAPVLIRRNPSLASLDLGSVPVGLTVSQTVTLENPGQILFQGLNVLVEAPFTVVNSNCGSILGANQSCRFDVALTGAAPVPATYTKVLTVNYNNGAGPQTTTASVVGNVVPPSNLNATPNSLNFGNAVIGSLSNKVTVTFTRNGATAVRNIRLVNIPAGFVRSAQPDAGSCPVTTPFDLAAGGPTQVCTMNFQTVVPAAGPFSGVFDAKYFADGDPAEKTINFTFNATGVTPARLTLSPLVADFGSRPAGTTSNPIVMTLTNVGGADATAFELAGLPAPFTLQIPPTGGCSTGLSIPPSGTCSLLVRAALPSNSGTSAFDAKRALGTFLSGENLGTVPPARVATEEGQFKVQSEVPATLVISPSLLDFQQVILGSAPVKVLFQVSNVGSQDANGLSASVPTQSEFTINLSPSSFPCGTKVAKGGFCFGEATFAPSKTGTVSDSITLDFIGRSTPAAQLDLVGQGVLAALLTATPPGKDLGGVLVGQKASDIIFVDNQAGGADAKNIQLVGFKGTESFTITNNTCDDGNLAGGSKCQLNVEFAPTAKGAKQEIFKLRYDNGKGTVDSGPIQLDGRGVGPALLVAEPPTFDFGKVARTPDPAPTTKIVFRNTGELKAVLTSKVATSNDFRIADTDCPDAGGEILPNGSCFATIAFAPKTNGNQSKALSAGYKTGDPAQANATVSATLMGEGSEPSALDIDIVKTTFEKTIDVFGAGQINPIIPMVVRDTLSDKLPVKFTNKGQVPITGLTFSGLPTGSLEVVALPGTCPAFPATLAGGATCTANLVFAPHTVGKLPATPQPMITYNPGSGTQSFPLTLSGTAVNPASVVAKAPTTFKYEDTYVGNKSSIHSFELSNCVGCFPAVALVFRSPAEPFFIVNKSCPDEEMAPGTTCNVNIQGVPQEVGYFQNTETFLSYFDGTSQDRRTADAVTQQIRGILRATLVYTGGNIQAPATLDFGKVALGETKELLFAVRNESGAKRAINYVTSFNPTLSATPEFKVDLTSTDATKCGAGFIGAGATCTFRATCQPPLNGVPGTLDRAFSGVYENDPSIEFPGKFDVGPLNFLCRSERKATLVLSAAPQVAPNPSSTLNFGTNPAGTWTSRTLSITNTGDRPAVNVGIGVVAPVGGVYRYETGSLTCAGAAATNIAAGQTCQAQVSFRPLTPSGTVSTGTLSVSATDTIGASIDLTGTSSAANPGTVTFTPSGGGVTGAYNFGQVIVNTSKMETFTVRNTGSSNLTGLRIVTPPGGAYTATLSATPDPVAPSGTRTLVVTFNPTVTGVQPATIVLGANNDSVLFTLSVSGEGITSIGRRMTVSPNPRSFGSVQLGVTSTQYVTLTNTGDVQISSVTLDSNSQSAYFSIDLSKATNLNPGASVSVPVTFTPGDRTSYSGSLVLRFGSPIAETVTLNVQGTGYGNYPYGSHLVLEWAGYRVFRVRNVSSVGVVFLGFEHQGGALYSYGNCTIGQVIPAGGNCIAYLYFNGYGAGWPYWWYGWFPYYGNQIRAIYRLNSFSDYRVFVSHYMYYYGSWSWYWWGWYGWWWSYYWWGYYWWGYGWYGWYCNWYNPWYCYWW